MEEAWEDIISLNTTPTLSLHGQFTALTYDTFPSPPTDQERRKRRMIKNRESASRSRARKQAYTNDLEIEVARLADENSKLRRQLEELRMTMTAQVPLKKMLQRTSSAPV